MSKLVFVYGTLRKGGKLSYAMENGEYLGDHATPSRYKMIDLGQYPAVTPNGDTAIVGEVYRVADEYMSVLDNIEGYPDLYQRTLIQTEYGKAYMYWMPDMRDAKCVQRIPSGDWMNREVKIEYVF